MSDLPLAIVVAVAENGVIGLGNALPWRLGTDLKRFRALTWGKPLIMGRRCWESIGRPLPGRETIVMTRRLDFAPAGVAVAHDWPEARALASAIGRRMGAVEIAVVGGAEIYRLALPDAVRLHLTRVGARPAGDVLFPPFDEAAFVEIFREPHPAGEKDEHPFVFTERVRTADDAGPPAAGG